LAGLALGQLAVVIGAVALIRGRGDTAADLGTSKVARAIETLRLGVLSVQACPGS
jgi:hypothetical protein